MFPAHLAAIHPAVCKRQNFGFEDLKKRNHVEDLDIVRKILKLISKKLV
jgi:hypothetical protein